MASAVVFADEPSALPLTRVAFPPSGVRQAGDSAFDPDVLFKVSSACGCWPEYFERSSKYQFRSAVLPPPCSIVILINENNPYQHMHFGWEKLDLASSWFALDTGYFGTSTLRE